MVRRAGNAYWLSNDPGIWAVDADLWGRKIYWRSHELKSWAGLAEWWDGVAGRSGGVAGRSGGVADRSGGVAEWSGGVADCWAGVDWWAGAQSTPHLVVH